MYKSVDLNFIRCDIDNLLLITMFAGLSQNVAARGISGAEA
jgi:hypothetical protein